MKNLKKVCGFLSITSLLLVASCNKEEATVTDVFSDGVNDLSSKSVELPISSNNVTASTSHSNYPVTNAVDGSSSTRWTGYGIGTELIIDLEREDFIDYIKIAHYRGSSRVYKFEVYTKSSSNSDWTKVGTKSSPGSTDSLYTYDISNSTGRYIKIESLGNSSNDWTDIIEIEAYGNIGEAISDACEVSIPSDRKATSVSSSEAELSWNAIANIDHYNVRYKKTQNTDWIYVYSLKTNSTIIGGLNSGQEYEWQVRAKCADGNGNDYEDATSKFTAGGSDSVSGIEEEQPEDEEDEEVIVVGDEEGPTAGTPYGILGNVIKDWKITYPVDENGNDSANADDCDDRNNDAHEQRDLTGSIPNDYADYFFVSGDEVVFKAHVGGATTSGSSYPRSEFRQLVGGDDNYWSMDEYQYLEVRVRATHLPAEKPEVSMVQIHGPDDEPLRVEYREGSQGLHVVQNESETVTYVLDYTLGQQLFVTVTVDNGDITLFMKNEDTGETYQDTWEAEDSTGYFKVGCYTQSNNNLPTCKPGEGYSTQNPNEYGEVRIKDLKLVETY